MATWSDGYMSTQIALLRAVNVHFATKLAAIRVTSW